MKHKYIIAALAASALVISCQQEENGPAQLEIVKTEELSLVLGDAPKSKVTVDGTTGEIAWNNGTDKIAVYVQGTGANEFQEKTVTDDAISVPLASGQSRAYFAVYPAASAVAAHYGNDYLAVQYPTSYNLSGMDLSAIETYSPVPMVADNTGSDALTFYHVGGLLRLSVAQTPATTTEMVVTFTGVPVTGTWRVTGGGTTSATLSSPTGTGNVVTYTMDALASVQTVTLNVPIPQGSYTGLTAIRVDAKAGSTTLASYTYSVTPAWASVTRALGRKEALSFADATLEITSPAATIWKGLTTTYTASSDAAVTWSSDTPGVATVNSSGVVTGVSAGTANITARTNGGAVVSDPVAVYVNAVTGVSLAPASVKVGPSMTTPLTATITINNPVYGEITSYPFELSFELDDTDYVRFNDASGTDPVSDTPVTVTPATTPATATASVNAYGHQLYGPAATVTVTVPATVSSTGSALTATSSVTCDEVTSITFPFGGGEKYKFRGYWIHPGFLFQDDTTPTPNYSITGTEGGEYDPLILLQHYVYDCRTTKFEGTGTAWTNRCYFTYDELDALDGSTDLSVTWTLDLTDSYGGGVGSSKKTWHIPSGGPSSEWYYLNSNNPSTKIMVNSTEYPTNVNTANYIYVNINLADAPSKYRNKGLGRPGESKDYVAANTAGNKPFMAGLLFVPDGAYITCSGIKAVPGSCKSDIATGSYNVISYDDLKILTDGGCIFMPMAGEGQSSDYFNYGGRSATYLLNNTTYAPTYSTWYAYAANLGQENYIYYPEGSTVYRNTCLPVFLIR